MSYVNSFRELEVYKLSRQVSRDLYRLSCKFPIDEKYSLTDQMRRSSRSVGAQIAESWGKRRYEKHFLVKKTDADSEQLETQHWIEIAFECGYLDQVQRDILVNQCEHIGKMLQKMIEKADSFCSKPK